jgi:hypothetical protein
MADLAANANVKEAGAWISRHVLSWKPLFESALAVTPNWKPSSRPLPRDRPS